MLGADRRYRVSGSRLLFPSTLWNLIVQCSSPVPRDNYGIINMPFPPTGPSLFFSFFFSFASRKLKLKLTFPVCSHNCHASSRQPGILWRHIVQTDLENKAVSEDLGIVSLQTLQESLVHCSTSGSAFKVNATYRAWASFCSTLGTKNTLPEPLMTIAPNFLFPYKAPGSSHTCTGGI